MTPFSLYLHIPFCRRRCTYCDFNTYAGLESLIPAYVQALCCEIRWVAALAGERLPVHTIFFGGGTPSLLPAGDVAAILEAIHQAFDCAEDLEATLEANPGTVSPGYLRDLRGMGVNRLSLGMQSAQAEELILLGRQHQLEEVAQAVRWARQAEIENLNLDLIFGLPGQSLGGWQGTLAMALSLQPDHLSLYALTLEAGTPLAQWVDRGLAPEPDGDLAADMYEMASERLERAGFLAYEISNWARLHPHLGAMTCRHNLQYWRSLPYLGFGAGAHGFAGGVRTVNIASPAGYIQAMAADPMAAGGGQPAFPASPAAEQATRLTPETMMSEYMLMGLRLAEEGVSGEDFERRFGVSLAERYGQVIEPLARLGLLEWLDGGGRLRLSRRGRLLGNVVFRDFV